MVTWHELRRQLDEVSELLDMYLDLGEVAAYDALLPQYQQLRIEWRKVHASRAYEAAGAGTCT